MVSPNKDVEKEVKSGDASKEDVISNEKDTEDQDTEVTADIDTECQDTEVTAEETNKMGEKGVETGENENEENAAEEEKGKTEADAPE